MALPKIVADLETSLAAKIAVGGTTGTLISNVDDDGVTLADGTYYFTLDGNNSAKEHIKCTKTGTALSDIYSVSRQGVETSGCVREHRVGAKVIMTDYATYKNYFEAAVISGPGSSTDNAITRWNGTGGNVLQNSLVTVDDNGSINIPTGQTYKINGTALAKGDVGLGNVDNTSDSTKNSATVTLTNKRITPRITTITSSATPTVNSDDCDTVTITAQAANITSMTTNLSGTPTNFQKLIYRIKDDGTARTITWGASFAARGVALPTTTTISKVLTVGFIYNTVTSTWDCIASAQES
jgi:hypothetical protein